MNTEDVKIEFPKLIIASNKIFLIVAGRIMALHTCIWKNENSFISMNKLQIRLHTSCHPD